MAGTKVAYFIGFEKYGPDALQKGCANTDSHKRGMKSAMLALFEQKLSLSLCKHQDKLFQFH